MNNIKFYRQQIGLTVRGLAIKSSIATGYISSLENDAESQLNPTKCVMEKISEALGKTVPEVFFSSITDNSTYER